MNRRHHASPRIAPRTVRRASTLVELLVSLPLAILAATAAALLIVRLGYATRAQSSALGTTRELRQVAQIVAADLESLGGRDLLVVSDTLLQFAEQLGVLMLCDVNGPRALVAAAPPGAGDLWVGALRSGDRVRLWRPSAAQRPPIASPRTLDGTPMALAAGTCGTDTIPRRRWRLAFGDSLGQAAAGTPVSVHRELRYRHYRSGTAWWLGRQSRDAGSWESIQPVAGPLRPPADGGMRLTARDVHGEPLRIVESTADSVRDRIAMVEVKMSMSRRTARTPGRTIDSVAVLVPLRAEAFRRR